MTEKSYYPIGIQTFSEVITQGMLYVDKTRFVYRMTHSYKYVFLSRPRRFGKSLLTSTLQAYFEGQKDLFKGLAIEALESRWGKYPTLHFDMSKAKSTDREVVEEMLDNQLLAYEQMFGKSGSETTPGSRLEGIIRRAYQKTGKQAVVLIDEYDSPLLGVLHDEQKLADIREVMTGFYSPLKASDPYLRFCFITGITKFSQLSIFSALNNIKNISMMAEYAAICGITRQELETQMSKDVDNLAQKINLSRRETIDKIVEFYDGYHFAGQSPDILNPHSLLNAMSDGKIKPYWFDTGTPTFLIEMMRKFNTLPSTLGREEYVLESSFDAPSERMNSITPLLYQSGYTTIKGYDPETESYTLDIPNREIRIGLMESLVPYYIKLPAQSGGTAVVKMYKALREDDMDAALVQLQKFLATVPHTQRTDYEGHYQQVLFIIFSLMGMYCDVEVHTPQGRVDLLLCTRQTLYIIELKMNRSATAAMSQIDLKEYPARFENCNLPRVKVAINFDSRKRNITDWIIQPAD